MNMIPNDAADKFSIGQRVNVSPLPDDIFSNHFTGHIKGFRNGGTDGTLITVEDMDGDCWDCVPEQVSPNTDEILHSDVSVMTS